LTLLGKRGAGSGGARAAGPAPAGAARGGGGGGGFRFVYGAFLQEASAVLGKPELMTLSAEITGIGDAWRDFALEIARLYKQRSSTPDVYKKLSKDLYDIAQREKLFFRKLKAAVEH